MAIGRSVLAGVAGIVAGGLVVAGVEAAAHAALAGPALFAAAALALLPAAALGTWVTRRIAGPRPTPAVPIALAALTLINVASFAHPWWFVPLAAAMLVAGWAAARA